MSSMELWAGRQIRKLSKNPVDGTFIIELGPQEPSRGPSSSSNISAEVVIKRRRRFVPKPELSIEANSKQISALVAELSRLVRAALSHREVEVGADATQSVIRRELGLSVSNLRRMKPGALVMRVSDEFRSGRVESHLEGASLIIGEMLLMGFVPSYIFVEEESGRKMWRESILALMTRAFQGDIEGAFVYPVDRFGRHATDAMMVFEFLATALDSAWYSKDGITLKPVPLDHDWNYKELQEELLDAQKEHEKSHSRGERSDRSRIKMNGGFQHSVARNFWAAANPNPWKPKWYFLKGTKFHALRFELSRSWLERLRYSSTLRALRSTMVERAPDKAHDFAPPNLLGRIVKGRDRISEFALPEEFPWRDCVLDEELRYTDESGYEEFVELLASLPRENKWYSVRESRCVMRLAESVGNLELRKALESTSQFAPVQVLYCARSGCGGTLNEVQSGRDDLSHIRLQCTESSTHFHYITEGRAGQILTRYQAYCPVCGRHGARRVGKTADSEWGDCIRYQCRCGNGFISEINEPQLRMLQLQASGEYDSFIKSSRTSRGLNPTRSTDDWTSFPNYEAPKTPEDFLRIHEHEALQSPAINQLPSLSSPMTLREHAMFILLNRGGITIKSGHATREKLREFGLSESEVRRVYEGAKRKLQELELIAPDSSRFLTDSLRDEIRQAVENHLEAGTFHQRNIARDVIEEHPMLQYKDVIESVKEEVCWFIGSPLFGAVRYRKKIDDSSELIQCLLEWLKKWLAANPDSEEKYPRELVREFARVHEKDMNYMYWLGPKWTRRLRRGTLPEAYRVHWECTCKRD